MRCASAEVETAGVGVMWVQEPMEFPILCFRAGVVSAET